MSSMPLTRQFQDARKDNSLVVLEGFHAIKHALRFGAKISHVATDSTEAVRGLAESLAPEMIELLDSSEVIIQEVSSADFATLSVTPVESHLIAIAERRAYSLTGVLARDGAIVLLDQPTHPGNVGAVIRVAAARGIAGVIVLGEIDPWQGSVVRGAAGLQFAVPVVQITDASGILTSERPMIALHEIGTPLPDATIPDNAILVFGSERRGISPELRKAAHETVMIPMQAGVSSLNLATSVAIILHTQYNVPHE